MQSGSVSGANITLSGGAAAGLILGGSLATPGTLLLLTNGVVAQPGGGITAGLLTTGSSVPSSVTLTQPANQIAALGQFATVGDTTIAVAGNLSLVSTLDARNVALAAGSIDQSGIISADNVALQASGPIVLNGTVASAGVLRLLTPGDVTQTGGAVLAKLLTTDIPAASISLPQAGNQVQALGPVMVTGKLSLVDERSLAITGPVTAGTLTLTTGAGAGTNGSLGVAGDLAAGASATFVTASDFNQVSGTITAPEIVQTAGGSTLIAGTIISPSLLSTSGVGVTLSGEIITAGVPQPKLHFGEKLPEAPPGGLGATFVIDGTSAAPFSQTLAPGGVSVQPIGGTALATIRIDLHGGDGITPGSGTVRFGNFIAPRTNLILNLGAGFATGPIDVNSLLILGNGGGTSLSGIVNNFGGSQAAGVSIIAPISATNYRINSCVIASVNCVLLPQETVPVNNPVRDLVIAAPRRGRSRSRSAERLGPGLLSHAHPPPLALLALLPGCATPPPDAYVHGATSGKPAESVSIGKDTSGADCTQQAGAHVSADVYCGTWQNPSARVRSAGPVAAGGLMELATAGSWRAWIDSRFLCGPRRRPPSSATCRPWSCNARAGRAGGRRWPSWRKSAAPAGWLTACCPRCRRCSARSACCPAGFPPPPRRASGRIRCWPTASLRARSARTTWASTRP